MTQSQKGGKMKGGVLNSLNTMDKMSVASQDKSVSDTSENNTSSIFMNKNIIIIILCGLLVMSFLGMNIFFYVGLLIQFIANKLGGLVTVVLEWIGFYTGAVINTSADVVADTAQASIDIAEGTVHSVGNLLQNRDNVSGPLPEQLEWDAAIFETRPMETEKPNIYPEYETRNMIDDIESGAELVGSGIEDVANEIKEVVEIPMKIDKVEQQSPTLDETINTAPSKPTEPAPTEPTKSWCFVGEYDGRRSCTQVDRPDMCMSGQLYENQMNCLDIHPKSNPLYKDKNPENKYKRSCEVVRTRNWGIRPPPQCAGRRTNQIPLVQQPPVQYYPHSLPVPINPYSTPIPMHQMLSGASNSNKAQETVTQK